MDGYREFKKAGLSTRAINCLLSQEIQSLSELRDLPISHFKNWYMCGNVTAKEIIKAVCAQTKDPIPFCDYCDIGAL